MFRTLNRWVPAATKGHKTPAKQSRSPKGPIANFDKRYSRFYIVKIRTNHTRQRIRAFHRISCQETFNQWFYSQSRCQEIQIGKRNAIRSFLAGRTFYRTFKLKCWRSTSDILPALVSAILLLLQSKYLHDITIARARQSNFDHWQHPRWEQF